MLGLRSKSFNQLEEASDRSQSDAELFSNISNENLVSEKPALSSPKRNFVTERNHDTSKHFQDDVERTQPEISTSISDVDIFNQIRKDVNFAKKKIRTEATFDGRGKLVFEATSVVTATEPFAEPDNINADIFWSDRNCDDENNKVRYDPHRTVPLMNAEGNVGDEPSHDVEPRVEYDGDEPNVVVPIPPSHPPPGGTQISVPILEIEDQIEGITVLKPSRTNLANAAMSDDTTEPDANDKGTDIAQAALLMKQDDLEHTLHKTNVAGKVSYSTRAALQAPSTNMTLKKNSEVPASNVSAKKYFVHPSVNENSHGIKRFDALSGDKQEKMAPCSYPTQAQSKFAYVSADQCYPNHPTSVSSHSILTNQPRLEQDMGVSIFNRHLPGSQKESILRRSGDDICLSRNVRSTHVPFDKLSLKFDGTPFVGSASESPQSTKPELRPSVDADAFALTTRSDLGFSDTIKMPHMAPLSDDTHLSFMGSSALVGASSITESRPSFSSSPWLNTLRGREQEHISQTRSPYRAVSPHNGARYLPQSRSTASLPRASWSGISADVKHRNKRTHSPLSLGKMLSAYVDEVRSKSPPKGKQTKNIQTTADPEISGVVNVHKVAGHWKNLTSVPTTTQFRSTHGAKSNHSHDFLSVALDSGNRQSEKLMSEFYDAVREARRDKTTRKLACQTKADVQGKHDNNAKSTLASKSLVNQQSRYGKINIGIGPPSSMEKVMMRSIATEKAGSTWRRKAKTNSS